MSPRQNMEFVRGDETNVQRLVNAVTTMLTNGIIHNPDTQQQEQWQQLEPIDPYGGMPVPYLPNLRDLLRRTTGSDDLASVTEVKLKVITRDFGLQHLSVHTPNLCELTLDGSLISSLRDLGCRLHSLKVLRVNRCKLRTLDGLSGLRNIEKLYAANNKLTDLTPCTSLEFVRHIDVTGNLIDDINVIAFLVLCPNLKDLVLEENFGIVDSPSFRDDVKRLIPQLKTLDGIEFTDECTSLSNATSSLSWSSGSESPSRLPVIPTCNSEQPPAAADQSTNNTCYTVSFTPRVFSPRNENNEQLTNANQSDVQVNTNGLLPKI